MKVISLTATAEDPKFLELFTCRNNAIKFADDDKNIWIDTRRLQSRSYYNKKKKFIFDYKRLKRWKQYRCS